MEKLAKIEFQSAGRPVDWLRLEFSNRRRKNSAYSIRAFARHLNIPSGRMSELMSGKRRLTRKLGIKIATKLGYSPEVQSEFLGAIQRLKSKKIKPKTEFCTLEADQFRLISVWYHYGILNLINTRGFKNDEAWIAKRLAISTPEVREAIDRLYRMNLIEDFEGSLRRVKQNLSTSKDIVNAAIQNFHVQVLEKAKLTLEETAVEKRDFTGVTMAFNTEQIGPAKELITKFRRELMALGEKGDKSEVYHLAIQLFPLSKEESIE